MNVGEVRVVNVELKGAPKVVVFVEVLLFVNQLVEMVGVGEVEECVEVGALAGLFPNKCGNEAKLGVGEQRRVESC